MEEMAEYKTPYVTKLLNLKVVYTSNKAAENKYMELQKKLQEKMKNARTTLTTAKNFFDKAYQAYALLILSNSAGECWFNLYQMLTNIESGLFIINCGYIKKGVKHVPEEISHLKNLPENFTLLYKNLFESSTIEELKTNATKLAQSTKNFMESKYKKPTESISSQKIIGTYEEIFSNWKNKVEISIEKNDIYSQFMAIASCQNFYNEMNLLNLDLLSNFKVKDLKSNAYNFVSGMEEWGKMYEQNNIEISIYKNIAEFENDYLK